MMLLTVNQVDNELRIDSRLVSKELGIEHKNTIALIDTYISEIESSFGGLAFETDTDYQTLTGISRRKCCHLTEDQAMFVTSLSKNTLQSVALKAKIVLSFSYVRKKIAGVSIPSSFSEALRLAASQAEIIEKQSLLIEESKPKIEFFDQVTESHDAIDLGSAAKVLNLGIGRNSLFEYLRNNKVLMSNNVPYQSYVDQGWFRVIETKFTKPDGSIHISIKTLVHQKGMNGILRMYKKTEQKNLS